MTFTVLARDRNSGLLGAATASRSLAAGNAVLAIRPGVGAVASQAWTNRSLRGLLLDELAAGTSAPDAVERIPAWDERAELRQVAALPATGPGAARSGRDVTEWAGHIVGTDIVVAGNFLSGPDVLPAMIARLAQIPEIDAADPERAVLFARELVAALTSGERAGGDARGRQSAAVLVAAVDHTDDLSVDLRVDDHLDPLPELTRLVALRGLDLSERISARTE
ncbi:DUF1028 domain-containing protein [Microbacterium sp. cx-55]|uniref:DUF1028 domain-containing protein n=1 Tax=Microbacterium sp. cx-55 TaxID=2875948 RepID=UPI001CBCEF27|nr:DUF1028 domain-containing protein [Microbacterium sp. cx-55]MBZ4488062.1 DUF1028 domain-containing protein [Microbacterium sp. cx-55]UGB34532.1 DUF1028 domain-containing protein [Microbacterium sp. cx-55]